jgi:hypothetical protein
MSNDVDEMHRDMMRAGRAVFSALIALGEQFARAQAERARREAQEALAEAERVQRWLLDCRSWAAAQVQGTREAAARWDEHMQREWGLDIAEARAEARRLAELDENDPDGMVRRIDELFGQGFVNQIADDIGAPRPDRRTEAEEEAGNGKTAEQGGARGDTTKDTGEARDVEHSRGDVREADDDKAPPVPKGPPYSHEFLAHLHAGSYPDDPEMLGRVYADPDAAAYLQRLEATADALRGHGRAAAAAADGGEPSFGVWQGGSASARLAGQAFESVMGTHGEDRAERPDLPEPSRFEALKNRLRRRSVGHGNDKANDLGM